jgi:WD40 repeat protein
LKEKKIVQKLDGFHTIAVVLLAFSPSGKLLFTCGNDDKNTFAIYDWRSASILYSGPISNGKVNGITWKNESDFMTVGNDHVKIWSKNKGQQGKIGEKPESMISCVSSKHIYITGSANGNIYNWIGN